MEHRTDLADILYAGLDPAEQAQTAETIGRASATALRQMRSHGEPSDRGEVLERRRAVLAEWAIDLAASEQIALAVGVTPDQLDTFAAERDDLANARDRLADAYDRAAADADDGNLDRFRTGMDSSRSAGNRLGAITDRLHASEDRRHSAADRVRAAETRAAAKAIRNGQLRN